MRRQILLLLTVASLSLSICQDTLNAQGKDEVKASAESTQAAMAQWMELLQPGPEHKTLAPFIGSWKVKSTIWMAGPDAPPTTATGTTEITWILGGRYTQQIYKSSMMGMPYEAIGVMGFDRGRNVYCQTWKDNMGTGISVATGGYDAKTKVFTLFGKMDDPLTQTYGYMTKSRTTVLGPDKFTFEMFNPHEGENVKMMEIIYERVK